MTRIPARGRAWAALLLMLVVAGLWAAPVAFSDPPAGNDPKKSEKEAATTPPTALTARDVEDLLYQHLVTLVALALGKLLPAVVGLVLFLLEYSRLVDVHRGLLPPPPPAPPWRRTAPADVVVAVSALGVLLVGPSLVMRLGIELAGEGVVESLPFRLGATAAATVPIAVWVTVRRRAAARRSPAGEATAYDYVFGPGGAVAVAPAPPMRAVLRDALRTFCVATAAALGAGLLAKLVLKPLGVPFGNQELVMRMVWPKAPYEPALISAYGVLVAPWVEECIFRGLLQPSVARRFGRSAGVWVSTLIFAAFHLQHMPQDLYSFFPLVALAFFLARLKDRTESIFATTVVHALNNLTTLVPLSLLRA